MDAIDVWDRKLKGPELGKPKVPVTAVLLALVCHCPYRPSGVDQRNTSFEES